MYAPEKYTPAVIEFVDIAGLVKGASKGEGLGNKFLANIREVDAITHVVRCFDDGNIIHVDGATNPKRDIETINLELIFSDIEFMERRIDRIKKTMKGGDKQKEPELRLCQRILDTLTEEKPARLLEFSAEEQPFLHELPLLTLKPVLYAANISEEDINKPESDYVKTVREIAKPEGAEVVVISAKIEDEIAMLDEEEKSVFLEDLGIDQSGLDQMIQAGYKLLGLISFLTAGPTEVRAWTIENGTKAPAAAGKIHTDFERGFIRAEIVSFDDLMKSVTYTAAKEKGLVRSEGKEYVMKDGDVVLFRFNV